MWVVTIVIAMLVLLLGAMVADMNVTLRTSGERVVAVAALLMLVVLFFLALSRTLRMQRWRVAVQDGAVNLSIPGRKSGLDPFAPVKRMVPMAEIDRVETRLTDIAGLGRVNTLHSTALRLKDGSVQKIGDTRIGNRFVGADDPGGDAGKVIADALGAPLFERNKVAGKGRLSMLSRVSTPPWDTPPMAPDEHEQIADHARKKGIAFAVAFMVLSVVGIFF
jgi:hypothetical protein